MLDKGGDEVLARLFAVADDVDAGLFLIVDGQAQGVLLAGGQVIAFQLPGGPQGFRCRQPGRFRQAAGGGGGQKLCHDGVLGA